MDNLEKNVFDKVSTKDSLSPFLYGVILAAIFSTIFLLAKLLGLEKTVWLRFLNYLIFFPVAYIALKKVYHVNEKLNYFNGLRIGFLVCFWGMFIYAILFYTYLHFDKELLAFIISQVSSDRLFSPEISITFILFSEGFAWSAITAFSLMQIFKWKRGLWAVHS